jgi:hypothetical protein
MKLTHDYVCICGNKDFSRVFVYTEPPEKEVRFESVQHDKYYREVLKCDLCGHYVSLSEMDITALYTGDYVASNYMDIEGIHENFKRINSLDPKESDNTARTVRVNEFAKKHFSNDIGGKTLLDIGSGLGVFPYTMKQLGWVCTALDPDSNAVRHLERHVGVRAVKGEFLAISDPGRFDVITFNKVLEHVQDPVSMLVKSQEHLRQGGFVYLEVPDGEMAACDGKDREEFSIDHLHVFSFLSVTILAQKAGFTPVLLERLQEPSTKYTLRMFLTK